MQPQAKASFLSGQKAHVHAGRSGKSISNEHTVATQMAKVHCSWCRFRQRQKDYHYPKEAFLSCNSINSNWEGDICACTSTSQEIKRAGQITSTVIRMMKIRFSSFSCSQLNFQFWSREDLTHTGGYSEYKAISHHVEYELYIFSSHKGSEALL